MGDEKRTEEDLQQHKDNYNKGYIPDEEVSVEEQLFLSNTLLKEAYMQLAMGAFDTETSLTYEPSEMMDLLDRLKETIETNNDCLDTSDEGTVHNGEED